MKAMISSMQSVPWHWWLIFAGIIIAIFVFNNLLAQPIANALHKKAKPSVRQNPLYIIFIALRYPLKWLALLALAIVIHQLASFNEKAIATWSRLEAFFLIVAIYTYAQGMVKFHMEDFLHFLMHMNIVDEDEVIKRIRPLLRAGLRVLLFLGYVLTLMHFVLRFNINGWLAGLGVLGLGASLAMQDTFSNLIATITIIIGKPFKEGQRIVFDGIDGIVEKIGLRGTSIRTLSGHLTSVPNSTLVNNAVENIGERPYIKRIMNIGITYDTPQEKVNQSIKILKDILANREENKPLYVNPDLLPKIYFRDLDSTQLSLIAIYWYHPPNYWDYMEHAQSINLRLFEAFEKAGIDFAFPTQTIHLANDAKRQLALKMLAQDLADKPDTKSTARVAKKPAGVVKKLTKHKKP